MGSGGAVLVCYMVAAVCAYDFMCTFFALPLYWRLLGGSFSTYGLVFGLYSLSRALGSPVVGLVTDRWLGFRVTVSFCLLLMAVGNALYFLASAHTYVVDDVASGGFGSGTGWEIGEGSGERVGLLGRWMLLMSRLIGGFGASSLSLVMSYIVQATADSEKMAATNRYRFMTLVGGMSGAIVGTAALQIPFNHVAAPYQLDALTAPALLSLAVELIVLVVVLVVFVADTLPATKSVTGDFFSFRSKVLRVSLLLNALGAFQAFALYLLFSQLTILSFFYYDVSDSISSLWKSYLPLVVGSLVAMLLLRVNGKRRSRESGASLSDRQLILYTPAVCIAGLGILLCYFPDKPWTITFYYIGVGLYFAGNNMYSTGMSCSPVC